MRSSVMFPSLLLLSLALLALSAEAATKCTNEGDCQACVIGGKKGARCCNGGVLSACSPGAVACAGELCSGGKICRNKLCVCPDGLTDCDGSCRNLATDPRSCGECNNACPIGMGCQPSSQSPGVGVCTCLPPTLPCGGVCRNPSNDPSNCGTCGHVCTAPTAACLNGQCAPPPGPTNSPTAGTTGNLPLDLFWGTTDPNGLPFNPDWRARSDDALVESNHVDLAKACPACNPDPKCLETCHSGGTTGGSACLKCFPPESCYQGCTTFPLGFDDGHFCSGHVNWMPATYDGTLEFNDHTARGFLSSAFEDDDYTFNLIPTGGAGLAGRNTLHSEMAFLETVDHFQTPFWKKFHDLVDDVPGDDLSGPRSLFDRDAILIGLLSIDTEHGAHSEIHPIYAMALRNTVNPRTAANPRLDCWAMFARTSGGEGGCSKHEHFLGLSQVTFRLPLPGATAVTEISRNFLTNTSASAVSEVSFVQDGAEITLVLGQSEQGARINGEICLRWAVPAGAQPRPVVAAATDLAAAKRDEDRHPGIDLLTPAQLAQLNASLPARKARDRKLDMLKPKRVPAVAKLAHPGDGTVVVRDRVGPPDVQKEALERQIHRQVCEMLRRNPKRPAICDQP